MALLPNAMEEAAMTAAIKTMSSDLVYLFEDLGIPAEIQAAFGAMGVTDISVFAKLQDTSARFRDLVKTDVKLDPSLSPAHRTMTAKVVLAWEAATKRLEKRFTEEAEQRVGDLPRSSPPLHSPGAHSGIRPRPS